MAYGNLNVDTVTTSTAGGVLGAGNASIMKNRIINGAMVIDQRNAGASVTQTTSTNYPVDRFGIVGDVTSKFTAQQSSTAPAGFTNSLLITSSSAYTVGASESYVVQQKIEGYNVADLGWGTADAKTITVSFWVRSSLTGTFGGSIKNSASNRWYPFSYTISAANTWEQKSVTIAGDTSGTWVTNNGTGLVLIFSMGAGASVSGTAGSWTGTSYISATGATSVVGTNGATFYITGVQLEVGSSATGYEYRQYGQELALCQRYFQQLNATNTRGSFAYGNAGNTTVVIGLYAPPVQFRAYPSLASSNIAVDNQNGPSSATLAINSSYGSLALVAMTASATGLTALTPYYICANNTTSAYVQLSAEL
jgi:hypothetical protein